MTDLRRKDLIRIIPHSNNPSSRNFCNLLNEARNIYEWRNNLPLFFKDITGNEPYPYQVDFLKKMQNLKNSYAIISAGRGTGKTECMAVLALWYVYVLPLTTPGRRMQVVILAGSEKQAKICYGYVKGYVDSIPFLQKGLAKDPTMNEIVWTDGSYIRPLTASEKSVRGPHPDMLIVDEACQADDKLLTSAMPMIGTSPYPRLILSSTPDKFFSLFVDIYSKRTDFPQFLRFSWSAEMCPNVSKGYIDTQKKIVDKGNYSVEYLGVPYSFSGKVFPLDKLKECVKYRSLIASEGKKYAGIDWGFYPAPTVITIVERIDNKEDPNTHWKLLHAEEFLKQNFEDVINELEKIAQSYNVERIYADSSHIGENQRLSKRGIQLLPIKFKGEKSAMLSNLRAIIENERVQIDGAKDYPLVAQLRDYQYTTKKGDDYVDSLMLALRGNRNMMPSKWSIKDYIVIKKRRMGMGSPMDLRHQMDRRYFKPEEFVSKKERETWDKIKQMKHR